ncbi:serine O-acetyltransferase [Shinella sumterensis]|uniref:serine O-acetyltransferase n=1 Tax=Shinella sumterensis TaxID=1967501 RepID=UPI00106ED4CC|nr:serine O-acetyltransferase [Shinella sumterensis]MCD1262825.1 serine O-acetyltransferase [Shinella sumterensis]MDP9591521.1 serine O-acetyltransferase [Shinella zoogloeoides]TFE94776.1 serine O-acetyltransferase [Shinella sumterensis]
MTGTESNVVFFPIEDAARGVVAVLWQMLREEAAAAVQRDPALGRAMNSAVLMHASFGHALSHRLAIKLADHDVDRDELLALIYGAYSDKPGLLGAAAADLQAVKDRDPSNGEVLTPFLYFKGFSALQAYRVGHWLWTMGRRHLARHIQSRISEAFAIDIHPAAVMGRGIMLDHGSGLVIGETAVVEDDVSILQNVTLGGTGKQTGDRHPKVRRGALIGAGAKILGNIEVGVGAKIGAGSVVLAPVAPYTSVVGVPARPVGKPHTALPGVTMDQSLSEPEYII